MSGWKRMGVILASLWGLAYLLLAAWSGVAWYGTSGHAFMPQDIASFALATALFLAIPAASIMGAGRFFRITAGYQGELSNLTLPKAAWVVLAFFLACSFLLPGWVGLAMGVHSQAAQAMGAWQILGQPKPDAYALALIFLPQWALYTLGSWILMRIVDWVWLGFRQNS